MDTDIRSQMSSAVGANVTLECRESVGKGVTWQYQKTADHLAEYVYYIGTHYHQRFNVNHSVSNQYDLNIASAEVADTGQYICTEDGGQGIRHIYHLSVIGKKRFRISGFLLMYW